MPYTPKGRTRVLAGGLGLILAIGAMTTLAPPAANAADCATVPWMNSGLSAGDRAQALLDASSQQQKYRWLVEQPANNPAQTTWSGGTVYPAQVPCTPTVVYTDGPDGVRFTAGVTAFPAPIAYAASWNLKLNEEKSAAQAAEAFDKGKNGVLGPGLSGGRTPLAGRTPEYFGEDPLLTGTFTAGAINALQSVPGKPVMADIKHYVANEQELDRQTSSSNIDERTLRQVYDLPVEIATSKSDAASVMCSYNQINGVFGCENPLLTTNLKGIMGFNGYVVSDFGAVHSTAAALNNGLDQELNRPIYFTPTRLDAALSAGEISQARIDEAAKRVVTAYIKHGLFDTALPATPVVDASTEAHKRIALETAQQSAVLLRNEGVLPLAAGSGTKIAVIGRTASATVNAGVSAKTVCSMAWQAGNTMQCEDIVSPEAAITARAAAAGATVSFDPGTDLASASALAAASDVAIVFGYQRMGEFNDLANLSLQSGGDALVDAVASANSKTVVVLNTGSAVEMPWLSKSAAVVEAWYGGEQGGPALAGLLWGDVNPSGKLPMTFPKALTDTPTGSDPARYPGIFSNGTTTRPVGSTEIRQVNFSEGLQVGYKWYDEQGIEPLFEFGHGLSYTTFGYTDLAVSTKIAAGGAVSTVAFTVTNTGSVAGTEVPQVYLTLPEEANEPGKRLVGFDRISLAPGEQKRVEVVVDSKSSNQPFSIWDVDANAWKIVDGAYAVSVGSSSRNLPLTQPVALDLAGDKERPTVALISPTTAGPFTQLTVKVDAADAGGLQRIVANIYKGATLVKSTQTPIGGATAGSHSATVTLPSGDYTVKYNAQDLAGNISKTSQYAFTIDATLPVATVKDGTNFTVGSNGVYDLVSFKLSDAGKIDKVTLNGVVKDLTNNPWSDVNFIKPGVFGAAKGANTLVVFDVAGNSATYTFTLN